MKKLKKTLLITGIIIALIIAVLWLLNRWLQDYSVEISEDIRIPQPVKTLPSVRPDSSGWPSWKGITHNNHSAYTNIIRDWSNGLELLWSVDYLCKGDKSISWSCPVISGNHLVVPGRHDQNDIIFCLDPQSGQLLWYHTFDAPVDNPSYGEGPRATPTIDGDQVYVLSRGGQLKCLNLKDGSVLWQRNYLNMGAEEPIWGFSSSPVIFGNMLLVQAGNQALVYGLNKMSGETIWQSEAAPTSYSTPALIRQKDEHLLLATGGQAFFVINPHNGSVLWKTPWEVKNNINICTPLYSSPHSIAIISSWYDQGTQAIRIDGNNSDILWHSNAMEAHQADPIIIGDHIYGFSGMSAHNNDEFKCLEILKGKEIWTSSELGSGQFIYVDPFFLSIDINGTLYLSLASPEGLKTVTRIDNLIETDNARFWTKPVTAQGNLYLRYANQLYCYKLAQPN